MALFVCDVPPEGRQIQPLSLDEPSGVLFFNKSLHLQVDNGNYIGMVSMRDVVKCLIKEHHEDMGRMQEYIQGSY